MPTPIWPSTLPFICTLSALEEGGPEGDRLSINYDVGEPKVRRLVTAPWFPISGMTSPLTPTQFDAFLTFWNDDLGGGTLSFYAIHPVTGTPVVFKPTAQTYRPQAVGAGKRRVSLTFRWRDMTSAETTDYEARA